MPANSLSLTVFPYLFFLSVPHTHTSLRRVSEAPESVCTHVRIHSHPQRSNDGHWLESVFVILILCFFTSPSQGPSLLLSLLLLLQSGRLGGTRETESNEALRSEKSQKRETEK